MPYPRTFAPLQLRHLLLRNRIMQPAHAKGFSVAGAETARDLAYYRARARGGAALLYVGARAVHHTSDASPRFASGYRDTLEADRRIADALHEQGVVVFAQLSHFGANAATDGIERMDALWSSSDVPSILHGIVPKPLEAGAEMERLVQAWADAAGRVRDAGFDGIEVQLGHGYLLHQFLSPIYNKRDDEYGGSAANRARLACEILAAVRAQAGDELVVGCRLSAGDFVPGGLEPDDVLELAALIHARQPVDFINLTGPGYHAFPLSLPALGGVRDGWLAPIAGRLKAALPGVPVFVAGGFRHPDDVEAVLAAGQADVVGLNREQIADPDWANKARTGRAHQIYHCIRANQGCFGRVARVLPMACTVNPLAGREAFFEGRTGPAAQPRHWLVAGGGPAGLKAAETLARRGHRVTLAERSERLGGQVELILRAPKREDMAWVVRDLVRQLAELSVDVRLGMAVDAAAVEAVDPDAILVATGAQADPRGFSTFAPAVPAIAGHELPHVRTGFDVLAGRAAPTGRVAVLDDQGSRYSAAVVEVLQRDGCTVDLVTPHGSLFPQTMVTIDQPLILERVMRAGGFTAHLHRWVTRIEPDALELINPYTGETEWLHGHATVVLVTQRRADDALYRALRGGPRPVRRIGDCVAPRALDHAIFDGFVAGCEIADDELPLVGTLEPWPEPGPA